MSATSLPLEDWLAAAVRWAHAAGEIQRRYFHHPERKDIQHKGAIDLVTAADKECEAFLIERIEAECPDHGYVAEEGHRKSTPGGLAWYIDPLDGTTNFAHGYPVFCVSIALLDGRRPVLGVVYDPMRGETFTAVLGRGARLNGEAIAVTREAELGKSLLVTGFPYAFAENPLNLRLFDAFLHRSLSVRRDGSAALDLCYVACGRFDGFWELGLNSWDIAAGALILEEAGGRATQFDGGELDVDARNILATNDLLHAPMQQVLKEYGAY